MSWVSITSTADLEHYVVAALVRAINQAALGDTQTDRFTRVNSDVTALVRMSVASNSKNVLDSDTTKIPQSLRPDACWIIAWMMAMGLGIELTDQQSNEVANARERLQQVARGALTIEKPDTEDTEPDGQSGAGIEMIEGNDRVFTVSTMNGL